MKDTQLKPTIWRKEVVAWLKKEAKRTDRGVAYVISQLVIDEIERRTKQRL